MSSEPTAIRLRGLGKSYRIDRTKPKHSTLAESAAHALKHPLRTLTGAGRETFWALRDVDLDIRQGEVVGIVGRNGAGKSTLLKLLSRITRPSTGHFELRGRVGSLLEVGTGFHPELTGRENIYLNGSILGMSRREINRQFDAIVDFAGVERFLETPVKRYSSGMYVRLAFAVAAHLEPEILIVDEVLAVGDAEFQNKCLGKMQDVAGGGRTVLFVSHNVGTIQALCTRAVLLRGGEKALDGDVGEIVQAYLSDLEGVGTVDADLSDRPGTGEVEMTAVRLVDDAGRPVEKVVGGRDLRLEVDYANHAGLRRPKLIANLYDAQAKPVASLGTELSAPTLAQLERQGRFTCLMRNLPLMPGRYRLALALHVDGIVTDTLKAATVFDVTSTVFHPTGTTPAAGQAQFLLDHEWSHEPGDAAGAVPSSAPTTAPTTASAPA